MEQGTGTPLLSDSLYEKLCEARRYPGEMITHAWDARLQQWINDAMTLESALADRDQRIKSLEEAAQVAADALGSISTSANWYANNGARQALEVDYALCVEIPSEADTALTKLAENGITPAKP